MPSRILAITIASILASSAAAETKLEGHKQHVYTAVFSPDGKTLASASGDGTACIWDLKTNKVLHTLKKHKGAVYDVAFTPDGK